jgi:hypothetical protein
MAALHISTHSEPADPSNNNSNTITTITSTMRRNTPYRARKLRPLGLHHTNTIGVLFLRLVRNHYLAMMTNYPRESWNIWNNPTRRYVHKLQEEREGLLNAIAYPVFKEIILIVVGLQLDSSSCYWHGENLPSRLSPKEKEDVFDSLQGSR